MAKLKLTSGFGYIKDKDDHIISKFAFDAGSEHEFKDGYKVIEVESEAEANTIKVWEDPAKVEEALVQEEIDKQKRIDAIKRLKAKGKLRADYKEE